MADQKKPPVFCENYCFICKGARSGNSIFKTLQNIELKVVGKNGCIWGKARTQYYGVTPDKPIPKNAK
jgi:hypothetical protein